ncbi:hypothetical protein lerEdw1_015957, partial [Lerista edwardsae]
RPPSRGTLRRPPPRLPTRPPSALGPARGRRTCARRFLEGAPLEHFRFRFQAVELARYPRCFFSSANPGSLWGEVSGFADDRKEQLRKDREIRVGLERAMALLCWRFLLLAAMVALPGNCSGSSPHSVKYFYTAVSERGQGLPWFVIAGYLDGQRFFHYDSDTRRATPQAPWLWRGGPGGPPLLGAGDPERPGRGGHAQLLPADRQESLQPECRCRLHTMQLMYGCELGEDGRRGGFRQYGYDGRDFLAFDTQTLTWTAADGAAQVTKCKWEAEPVVQRLRRYLEEECPEELQRHLAGGREALQRREPPEVTVTRKDSHEGLETLLCRAHGFYPREIEATWRRDGEARQGDTFRGTVSPNADGTYHAWLSIEVDPQERSRFRCHVEHDGLREPLDVAVAEPAPVGVVAAGVALGVLLVLAAAGVLLYVKQRPEKTAHCTAPESNLGSDSSSR